MVDQTPIADHSAASGRSHARWLPFVINARWGGVALAGMLAVTGVFFAWQSTMLDLGGLGLPGPGFFPLLLALLLGAFSIVIGVGSWRAPATDRPIELGHPHVLITSAALLAVPVLFDPLGAYITLGLLSAVLLVFVARLSLLLSAVSIILGMGACWYLFEVLLGVRLPAGPF